MLGVLFRGVFLIGVLTWYSTSVWKLIDSYFRDQFRSYLEEESRRNPRLRSDLQGVSVDKIDPVIGGTAPETTVEPPREIVEVCGTASVCAVEAAETDSTANMATKEEVAGGASENVAAGGSIDKNAYQGTAAESELESRKSSDDKQESRRRINHGDRDLEDVKSDYDRRSVDLSSKTIGRRRGKSEVRSTKDSSRDVQPPRKRGVKTITLSEKDFPAKNAALQDDFWEFEEDAVEKEPLEGILVSELPFRPRIDGIGDVERVTADEYCPMTLEDEASCGETVTWP
ncbi:PREDICTED: uncharacterized protein LOC107194260 [Dufourea novaeangliae]|uniref:Uncharacterized protein n=1 Tax=Dufourea novaeangliae TaxID=178035 RepID=A0A154NW02_DUFNO|nr:PREDICTED: uncharacterized protein LOC107194260 [Dufourea novaeangliae]KZC03751.1 hypothetical protein WN55_06398 [Dufourea novaeangliae]